MKCLVTGAAGFIGSNLVDRLLSDGHSVVGFDNFSTGHRTFLDQASSSSRFTLIEADLLDQSAISVAMRGIDRVFHLAANADVRFGLNHPSKDLQQNVIATWQVLEAMRLENVKHITFSSTGSVYGEAEVIPTPETAPFPLQTSLYGASKLAAEGYLQAYAEGYGMSATIFRFVSVLGERYTHGHVVDFVNQLREHPDHIKVLGDGTQRKSYLYVADCIEALVLASAREHKGTEIFNLGTDEYCRVEQSLGWICELMHLEPRREYSGGNRGWVGDNPFIFLDCRKVQEKLNWKPSLTIRQAVEATVKYLLSQR
jgi:UDP-glucose 4-epimerase